MKKNAMANKLPPITGIMISRGRGSVGVTSTRADKNNYNIIILISGYIMYTSYLGEEDQLELHLHVQRIILYYYKWLDNVHIVPWVGIVRISVVWLIFLPSIRIMPTLCLRLPTAIVIVRGPELSRSC